MEALKDLVNWLASPSIYFAISVLMFWAFIRFRQLYRPAAGLGLLLFGIAFFAVSVLDDNFRSIVVKPDNVPIVMMIFLVGYFVWFAMQQGILNDERRAEGKELIEQEDSNKRVLVWPDLVYTELMVLIVGTIGLIAWSIFLEAPLEEPANPGDSPNPSKAPWYFLGLQELLVYFDPWIAGVLLPGLIIVGLILLPYIDVNPKGNGYYTFKERKLEIIIFLFGFVVLWVVLIILGTFLRGPNWNFFGPYEVWTVSKVEPLVNVNLSDIIFVRILGTGLPGHWLPRELPGILVLIAYFVVPPYVFAKRWFAGYAKSMGFIRYQLTMFLLLSMMSIPIKMVLRWTINFKYLVAIPEYFFNI